MSRGIVLGHTGFVGRHLVAHLERLGWEVVGLSSATADLTRPAGIEALAAHHTPDTVVYFASAVTPDRGASLETFDRNVSMAAGVADYLERLRPRLCVFFGSDAVYPMEAQPVTEESVAAPGDWYGAAKRASELVLTEAARQGGIDLLVLRPTAIFGPGDSHGSYGPNRFCRAVARDASVELFGEGEERRDHLYIDDLVSLTARLVEVGARGVVNLASGRSHAFAEVVAALEAAAGRPIRTVSVPRRGPITHREFDIRRLRRLVPDFEYTEFGVGLRNTYAWARGIDGLGKEGRAAEPRGAPREGPQR